MPYVTFRSVAVATVLALVAWQIPWFRSAHAVSVRPAHALITILADQPVATINPGRDWGAALDGHDLVTAARIYTPANIVAMKAAGLGPVSYRLRTELGIDAWHWNPAGRWSDAVHHQGYWTSDDSSSQPIRSSFGYRLPRRGRTIDDASNDGYSRVDDGDTTTFWKSNPYLDARLTHDAADDHPQWFTVDLGTPRPIREIRLVWGDPYPRRFTAEYWDGDQSIPIDYNPDGEWRPFDGGVVSGSRGGDMRLRLSGPARASRFVRVVMHESSHTAAGGNGDPRDSLGFALREMFVGDRAPTGEFRDFVDHGKSAGTQSAILVSSTDPWHREMDRDADIVQPGVDLLVATGITRNLPVLVPTGLLFDTPDNAAAELRFLRRRRYQVAGIELGEEPDGQRVTPEDYGALYLQFAAALRTVDRSVRLGGPSFQNLRNDPLRLWPDGIAHGTRTTWIGRFLDYIDARRETSEFNFFSFEWYPFDNVCDDPSRNLAAAPGMLGRSLARLREAGLPDSIARIMTEYGYSAHISAAEVALPSALFDLDAIGTFFTHGGSRSYLFGYEPGYLTHEPGCGDWGSLSMWLADSAGQARDRTPRFIAAWLLTHAWADSAGGNHELFPSRIAGTDSLLSAFTLRRPDRRWSVLLVNRDPMRPRSIDVRIAENGRNSRSLRGPADIWMYSGAQYRFDVRGPASRPSRDLPSSHAVQSALEHISMPPYSAMVITGW
jgi:hypothetical protein